MEHLHRFSAVLAICFLFRPSPDPETTDHEAELDFPRSTRFASVSPDHVRWFNALREKFHGSDCYP
jgi:hypothetical protein